MNDKFVSQIESKQIILFFISGGLTALLYYSFLFIFIDVLDMYYLFSVTLAFICVNFFQFIFNKKITFQSADKEFGTQLFKYIYMVFLSLCITNGIIWLSFECFAISTYVSALIALCITTPMSFFLSRVWVFSK